MIIWKHWKLLGKERDWLLYDSVSLFNLCIINILQILFYFSNEHEKTSFKMSEEKKGKNES